MRTLLAIVRDTVLALSRRRLFWLHLWLSVAVVLLFASIQFDPNGWSIGFGLKRSESRWLVEGSPWAATLHTWVLTRLLRWWLAGGCLFLTLFATSSVLPESLEPGAAALIMPKARRRSLLVGGRFLGALAYAGIHLALCTAGLWLVLGWRIGVWHASLWLALPMALALFAPLQAAAMLMGVLTKSATAALLIAILFAGSVWALENAAQRNVAEAERPAEAASETAVNGDDASSGLSDTYTNAAVIAAAAVLPRPADALLWMERRACPRAPRSARDLIQRLSGRSSISREAFDAVSTAPVVPRRQLYALPIAASMAAFTVAALGLAIWLLRRRDL